MCTRSVWACPGPAKKGCSHTNRFDCWVAIAILASNLATKYTRHAGVDRSLAEAQIASGGEIGEPAGIDAYDFGFDGGLTGQPVEVGATEDDLATDFSAVPTGVGATDDDLATDFSTVSVPTASEISPEDFRASEAALAGIDFETGLPLGGTVDDIGMAILEDSTMQAVKDRVSEVEGTNDAGGSGS